jgi:5-methylcytosine-specific restriction endonuclease McrA
MFAAWGCPACGQQVEGQPVTEPHAHVCAHCGHLGAGEADHIVPLAVAPNQPVSADGIRPTHGTSSRCPTCPPGRNGRARACNQERGAGQARVAPLVTSREW